eukprot:SAG22_NODE_404_length_11005_cov_8.751788_12_plen_92_part_00
MLAGLLGCCGRHARCPTGRRQGFRDELNDGKQPGHFLKSINQRIDERRKEAIMANRLEGMLPESVRQRRAVSLPFLAVRLHCARKGSTILQ